MQVAESSGMERPSSSEMKRFRDLPHRSSNEALKIETTMVVKLSETAAEFIQKVSAVEEQHAQQLNQVVKNFRRRTNESLKREPLFTSSSQFGAWEALLNETEQEAKCYTDLSQQLLQSINQQLLDLTTKKKQLMKRWFLFRDAYMSRVDKTEDQVLKLFRGYQDQWNKYSESLDKSRAAGGPDIVKDSVVLHSYNAHNEYVMQLRAFNALHEEFYGKQIYDMLDELQAVQEDLVKGFRTCMQKYVQLSQEKLNSSLSNLSSFLETLNTVSAPADISAFISGQNVSVKIYPPPKCNFRTPAVPQPKLPDSPLIDLTSLTDELQLVDMTQAPLMHAHEALKQKDFDLSTGLDQLHKEYQSVKTLLDSYRENPSLGDPNTLMEELLEMRNKIRVKEAEVVMARGKLSLFTHLNTEDAAGSSFLRHSMVEDSACLSVDVSGRPRKTSETFMAGRNHEFVEIERKLPVFCSYCDGILQPPISRGMKCKVCKTNVHHKCLNYITYCSGQPPVKNSPKFIPKRISMMLTRKQSNPLQSDSPDSIEEEDETLGGLYEAPIPMPPRPQLRMRKMESPTHIPKPPPRGESLDTAKYGMLEDVFTHQSFEDTVEFADSYSYCVAIYDYEKVNPNDMKLKAGEVIELINTASSDWWKGTSGDKKGYFPASYVQLVSHGDVIMRAIYDFSPQGKGEMPLLEGQIIVMTRNDGDGWLHGKSGDQEGLFPENYAEKITSL